MPSSCTIGAVGGSWTGGARVKGNTIAYHIGDGMALYSMVVDDGPSVILLTSVQETRVWELSLGILKLLLQGFLRHGTREPFANGTVVMTLNRTILVRTAVLPAGRATSPDRESFPSSE